MCFYCSHLLPGERPPCESRLATYSQVETLTHLGVPRSDALLMTPAEATAALGAAARDRWIARALEATHV